MPTTAQPQIKKDNNLIKFIKCFALSTNLKKLFASSNKGDEDKGL